MSKYLLSLTAGPISGVGQHVPSYCGACLKGWRLVTSSGPILEKCLAVSAAFSWVIIFRGPISKWYIFGIVHVICQSIVWWILQNRTSVSNMLVVKVVESSCVVEQRKHSRYNTPILGGTIFHSWWSTTTVYYWISYIGQYEYEYSVFLCDNLVNFPHQLPKLPSWRWTE